MTEIQGVDYSSTANADWAGLAQSLKDAGKKFVGRYAVNDKSPGGRGIGRAEYAAMRDAGVDVFLYWESSEGWMTNGWNAGVQAAQNAQYNLENAGIPANIPVYFACDFDAAPSDQEAIDNCLAGAASVLGKERVGLYAGYHVLLRARQNGACTWFCQTSAWSGGQVMEGTHLYQFAYNKYVYGTNCDWVVAYAENYGQAVPPVTPPPPPPGPVYAKPTTYPWLASDAPLAVQTIKNVKVYPIGNHYTALRETLRRQATGNNKQIVGPAVTPGEVIKARYAYRSGDQTFLLTDDGARIAAADVLPRVQITKSGVVSVRYA